LGQIKISFFMTIWALVLNNFIWEIRGIRRIVYERATVEAYSKIN
jgi:hypothetical protein